MIIPINDELKHICREIIDQNLSLEEWSFIESDDMFQSKLFEGGFDATANEFVFSYFGDKEYWFQLSMQDVIAIYSDKEINLTGIIAEV